MVDTSQQFVADAHGAVLNNDEKAWLTYKAARDQSLAIKNLKKQVEYLLERVRILEENSK